MEGEGKELKISWPPFSNSSGASANVINAKKDNQQSLTDESDPIFDLFDYDENTSRKSTESTSQQTSNDQPLWYKYKFHVWHERKDKQVRAQRKSEEPSDRRGRIVDARYLYRVGLAKRKISQMKIFPCRKSTLWSQHKGKSFLYKTQSVDHSQWSWQVIDLSFQVGLGQSRALLDVDGIHFCKRSVYLS